MCFWHQCMQVFSSNLILVSKISAFALKTELNRMPPLCNELYVCFSHKRRAFSVKKKEKNHCKEEVHVCCSIKDNRMIQRGIMFKKMLHD